jgi:hypothetical protein
LVTLTVALNVAPGCVMLKPTSAWHPFVSVTRIVYGPASMFVIKFPVITALVPPAGSENTV